MKRILIITYALVMATILGGNAAMLVVMNIANGMTDYAQKIKLLEDNKFIYKCSMTAAAAEVIIAIICTVVWYYRRPRWKRIRKGFND